MEDNVEIPTNFREHDSLGEPAWGPALARITPSEEQRASVYLGGSVGIFNGRNKNIFLIL